MKCADSHNYTPKTVRIPFQNAQEEKDFEAYLDANGLKKGSYILRLIRLALAQEASNG